MNPNKKDPSPQHRKGRIVSAAVILSLLLIVSLSSYGTVSYLTSKSREVKNTFLPSRVSCQVTESFDGSMKKNVNAQNTGDTQAYLRVKLVSYRVNSSGLHIGGTAPIPSFSPTHINWVKYGEYYYWTEPVEPGASPPHMLIGETGIRLTDAYPDADGGRQVIDVLAEAIQSVPSAAVCNAWGVSISPGSVVACQGGVGS